MRKILEFLLGILFKPKPLPENFKPSSIYILRNNDLGDYLLITPLLRELKRALPNTKIYLGIGSWGQSLAENNPWVDEIIITDAPWHNKQVCHHPANNFKHWLNALRFIVFSETKKTLKNKDIELGIDILGSPEGSLFLAFSGIKYRFGVRGYAGGDSACQKWVECDMTRNVGESALINMELLGFKNESFDTKPEIYLTKEEISKGASYWNFYEGKKVVIAPGGGFPEKCWPREKYIQLATLLSQKMRCQILILGGKEDVPAGNQIQSIYPNIKNLCGKTNLRETCAIVSHTDQVICNSSFMMHASAAFSISTIVLLGEWYDSTELHKKQWGHSTTTLLGKELGKGKHELATAEEVFERLAESWNHGKNE